MRKFDAIAAAPETDVGDEHLDFRVRLEHRQRRRRVAGVEGIEACFFEDIGSDERHEWLVLDDQGGRSTRSHVILTQVMSATVG
jgi:hypothetical protein